MRRFINHVDNRSNFDKNSTNLYTMIEPELLTFRSQFESLCSWVFSSAQSAVH